MKKLHLLLIKSFIGPLVMTFFIALFVLIMQFLFQHIDDLVGKGLEINTIAELLFYASASLVPMALPLAVLLASIMTFGNLGEYYELTAMKASGISLLRIMFPLILLVTALTLMAFVFSNNVLPKANLKTGALLYDIKHLRPELSIKVGVFNNDLDGYSIRAEDRNPETGMFYDFVIYDHTERRGNSRVTIADSAQMEITKDERHLIVTLYDGRGYEEMEEEGRQRSFPMRRNEFRKERLVFELEGFELERTDEGLFKHNYQMLKLSELNSAADSLASQLNKRKEQFYANMVRTNLMRKENKQYLSDTTKNSQPPSYDTLTPVNIDSLLLSLDYMDRMQVMDISNNFVKNAGSYVGSSAASLQHRERNIAKHWVQWHRKFTLSFACLIFFFLGAPLGAIIRKGGLGMPVVVSVLFFILYYMLSISGEKFAREGILTAMQGMWMSSVILLPLSIFLTYKAVTDSAMLNINYYLDLLKRNRKKT